VDKLRAVLGVKTGNACRTLFRCSDYSHALTDTSTTQVKKYHNLRLFVDIFWVNGSPYFHTISEWIKFCTVAPINNRSKKILLMETQAVTNMYQTRGFTITRVEADREFKCITNDLLPIDINIANADDHVHEMERSIRLVKERTRCRIQGLPF
jgi:hypothetical protein